jgi:methylated-DNA-[protein]-cysteine S-methyltransferase
MGDASDEKRKLVYWLLKNVPKDKVTTYRELGLAAGVHQRTVASFMKTNDDPVGVPCFRVIMSNGDIGGYGFLGPRAKEELLRENGIEVIDGKVPQKYVHRFRPSS